MPPQGESSVATSSAFCSEMELPNLEMIPVGIPSSRPMA